jgi:hypothetical protein
LVAGDVVCYFVAEDGGETVVVFGYGEDSGVDEDLTTGDYKGVSFCI